MAGNQKPSFNTKVVAKMTLEELIEMHPNADVDYTTSEWKRINGKILRKVTQGWLDAHPEIIDVKVGDMYPM